MFPLFWGRLASSGDKGDFRMWPSCDETVTSDSCRRVLISRKNTTLDWPLPHSRGPRSKRVTQQENGQRPNMWHVNLMPRRGGAWGKRFKKQCRECASCAPVASWLIIVQKMSHTKVHKKGGVLSSRASSSRQKSLSAVLWTLKPISTAWRTPTKGDAINGELRMGENFRRPWVGTVGQGVECSWAAIG